MIRHVIPSIFLIIAFVSCVKHDINDNAPDTVLSVASDLCGSSRRDMVWLQNLIQRSEMDFALRGDIYAINIDGRIIFLHQPWIMSCLGCVLYDCVGHRLEPSSVDQQKLIAGITPANRIYNPPME